MDLIKYSNDLPTLGRDATSVASSYAVGYGMYQREGADVSNTNMEALIALSAGGALGYVACMALGLPVTYRKRSAVSYLSSGLCMYHGYKRNNDSILYALGWGLTGTTGLGLSLAQGYAQPINNRKALLEQQG